MSKLYVVRHGQASFFADDYDKLSEMGERQSRVLGQYWLDNGVVIDEVYTGTLQRQRRTAECVGEVVSAAGKSWPEHGVFEGLNEYPADALMEHLLPHLMESDEGMRDLDAAFKEATEGREKYRTFHRLLETVMAKWIAEEYTIDHIPHWKDFSGGVRDAFHEILSKGGSGRTVAVFSSGGPVGISVQTALEAPDIKAAELNWRVHNASVTEFTFSRNRLALDAFNAIPHLTEPELLTYR